MDSPERFVPRVWYPLTAEGQDWRATEPRPRRTGASAGEMHFTHSSGSEIAYVARPGPTHPDHPPEHITVSSLQEVTSNLPPTYPFPAGHLLFRGKFS